MRAAARVKTASCEGVADTAPASPTTAFQAADDARIIIDQLIDNSLCG
jgi:hypothetical protein